MNIIKKKQKKETSSKKSFSLPVSPTRSIDLILTKEEAHSDTSFLFILIIFIWIVLEQAIEKYNSTISHLYFWMFELIIISYLNENLFKMAIYKHHKFVIFFNLLPISFKIITIYLSFKYAKKADENNPYLDKDGQIRLI